MTKRSPECELEDCNEESQCYSQCKAGRDGDCFWRACPQAKNWQRICPLDKLCIVHDPKWHP